MNYNPHYCQRMERAAGEYEIPRMKTIGVIGGLGPQATMDFEEQIHQASQEMIPQYVNRGYPPMIVHYFRHAPMILNEDGSPQIPLKPDLRLLGAARQLGTNVDFLVITSNTPHFFQKQLEEVSGRKMLSIVDVARDEVKRRNLKKVGVLAVGVTLEHKLYQYSTSEVK